MGKELSSICEHVLTERHSCPIFTKPVLVVGAGLTEKERPSHFAEDEVIE